MQSLAAHGERNGVLRDLDLCVDPGAREQASIGVVQHYPGGHRLIGVGCGQEHRDGALQGFFGERRADLHRRADADAGEVRRKHRQIGPDRRGIDNGEQFTPGGLLARPGVALGDDAADGRGDVVRREALIALDLRQPITGTDAITDGAGHRFDAALEARTDMADPFRIRRDTAIDWDALFDDRRPGDFSDNAQRVAHR